MPNCRDCQEPIKFARLGVGSIPVDATSTFEGSYVFFHEGGVLTARPARLPADQMRPRHHHHLDTCPSRRYRKDR